MAAEHQHALERNGFDSLRDIVNAYKEEGAQALRKLLLDTNKMNAHAQTAVRGARTTYFTPVMIKRLTGVIHYYLRCIYALHTCPNIDNLTVEMADQMGADFYDKGLKKDDEDDDEDLIDTEIPKLKGTDNWMDFRDRFVFKLAHIKGRGGYPIDYVVDETERAIQDPTEPIANRAHADFTDPDLIRTEAVHFGTTFKDDNSKVWSILKSCLLNTAPYNHIAQFNTTRNGRRAWQALRAYYQGEDFVQRQRESAFNILTNTFYKGETTRFNFEKYVSKHLEAHKKLLDAGYNNGNGMDEATKIQYLRSGIKESAGLENSLTAARTNHLHERDFQLYVTFLSAEVETKALRRQDLRGLRDRNISNVSKDGRSKQSQKPKRKRENILSEIVDGKKIESRRYSMGEWANLTSNQRDAVKRLNKERRQRIKSGVPKTDATSSISAIRRDMIEIGDAIVAGVTAASQTNDDNGSDTTINNSTTSTTSRTAARSANAGSVGEFLANQRQNRS